MPFSNKIFHTFFIIKLFPLVGFLLLWEGISCETVLDVSYPILIAENRDASSTVSKGYFGYTVSLSQGKPEQSSVEPRAWIFIGAPKSDTNLPDMYSSGTKEPGVLWRCSVGKPLGQEDSCTMMNIDPSMPTRTAKRPGNAPHFENFDDAWIGAALQVNYNRLLTCGHRWKRGKSNGTSYNGVCYWFADKEGQSSYTSSDLTKLVNKSTYDQRLIPFLHRGTANATVDMIFSNLTTNLIGHEWKAGQAGISLHLFQEGSGKEPNLLIGAPGVREWAGAVVFYNNTLEPKGGMERPNRNLADPTFSEFLVANRGKLFERAGQSQVRNHWGDYFGYSVSAGRYFSKDKILYAAGAPRAQYNGEVVIFDFAPYSTSKPNSTYKREIVPMIEIQPPNNSYASYFGAELHTLELEDGLDALAVGAPMYTFPVFTDKGKSKVMEQGSPSSQREKRQVVVDEYGDHGLVIVYKFKIGPNLEKNYTSEVLSGSKIPLARFGSAISSITFELKNGTKDIYLVIGAPYEPADDGSNSTSGAIYLYKYNSKSGKFGRFVQRIVASHISPVLKGLKGFGSSLSLPKDVDNNKTPDIAIGAYESGHVVLLRTRPKIEINTWISYKNSEGNEDRVRRGSKAFYIQSCVNVSETLGHLAYNADFWVKVKFSDRSISFDKDTIRRMPGNTANEIIYKKKMILQADRNCEELTIVPVHNAGIGMDDSDIIEEIKQPFHIMQEVWYNETIDRQPSLFTYYASDGNRRQQPTPQRINFHTFDHMKPSPQMARASKDVPISRTDCFARVCQPNVTLIWKFFNKRNEEISSYMLGSVEDVFLEIVAINSGETADQPRLIIDWARKPSVKESVSGDRWLHRLCRNRSEGNVHLTYACPLRQYIKSGRNVTSRIQFDMGSVFVDRPDGVDFVINGKVFVNDTGRIVEGVKSKAKLSLYVPPTTVAVKGSKENETLASPFPYSVNKSVANQTAMDRRELVLYSYFRQTFTVIVLGASVTNLVTQFKLPVQMEKDDQEPLFLVKELDSGPNVNCTITSKIGFYSIKPLGPGSPGVPSSNQIVHHEQSQFVAAEEMDVRPKRGRRDVVNGSDVAESNTIAIDIPPPPRPSKDPKMKVNDDEVLTLKCANEGTCLEVTCIVKNAKANTHIHFPFEMYSIKDRIDSVLKSEGKTSILVEGFGFAHIFNSALSTHRDEDVTQTMLLPTSTKQVELWVYVVAIISGILLLVLIVLGLYKCGFFKREKRDQLTNMKKEHHRKSMIAAARQSMMVQSTSADVDTNHGESRQNLTEAEHRNEDADPIPEKSSKSKTEQKEEMN